MSANFARPRNLPSMPHQRRAPENDRCLTGVPRTRHENALSTPTAHGLSGVTLPPTVVQAHNAKTGRTVLSVVSEGNAGCDQMRLGSFNVVFHPDEATRDAWRRWFQYVLSSTAPLNRCTVQIPYLLPAKGDPEAARLWEAFELACKGDGRGDSPVVDPITGEVTTDADGNEILAWDEGKTALDPIALDLQHIYSRGWLVTVDEATRIKPLRIPVKAKLLGQQAEMP